MTRNFARVLRNILRSRALLTLIGLLTIVTGASAQASGVISGTVTDRDNRPFSGVTITVTSPEIDSLRHSTITDGTGRYEIANLPTGTYTVTAELPAFITAVKTQRVTGERREVWLVMELGKLRETLQLPRPPGRIVPLSLHR